jgi:hypothetical protein
MASSMYWLRDKNVLVKRQKRRWFPEVKFLEREVRLRKVVSRLSYRVFFALDHMGVHLLPKHYYTPVADYSWLQRNPDTWMGRADFAGVRWDLDEQLRWVRKICEPHYHEVGGLDWHRELRSGGWGVWGYGPIESQVLHCFIRSYAPTTVVEIGSGISTACMLRASRINKREGRRPPNIISVEPFPTPKLREQEEITLIEEICQRVPDSVFDDLKAGDLLFIDSSHVVKLGSELLRIYLDIIPSLRPGVFIHIHDIYLPYLYMREALSNYYDWQETSLVLALLKNNARLSAQCCLSALHYDRPKEMAELLTDYRPQANVEGLRADKAGKGHFPCSLWLRTS